MRSYKTFLASIVAVMAVTFIGTYAQGSGDDRPLEQRIYKRLLNVTNYGVFDYITFQLQGSTVILDGKVSSFRTRDEAASDLKNLPGVTEVVNNIEQLPASPFDDEIRQRALVAFVNRGPSQYFSSRQPDVHVIVENGRVTLEGYVTSKSHSEWLNVLAHGISGVFSVQNNLVVGRDTNR
jgi:hyperosmotically inducible periplasmic protein